MKLPWCRFHKEYLFVEPGDKSKGIKRMVEHLGGDVKDVVVFGDDALVVADVESDAVLERFACQLELVAPVDGELYPLVRRSAAFMSGREAP